MNKLTISTRHKGAVLGFGELLFRVSLDANGDWLTKQTVPLFVGGAELNVAAALALWDVPAAYFTALPDNHLSKQIIEYAGKKKIGINKIMHHPGRMGLYYLTTGADLKNNSLIYDRAGSAFSGLKPGVIDWDQVLDGISWLHLSAICPALNQNVADVCREALMAASAKGIITSIDLNYRASLWAYGKKPVEVIPALVEHCDLVMGNIWAADIMLGIPVDANIHQIGKKDNYLAVANKTSELIIEHFPKCKAVANTFRFDNRDGINYYTTLYTGGKHYHTEDHTAATIINRVGSGDCFMAGLIYGFYNGHQPDEILKFATLAALDKLFIAGDATTSTVQQIKNTLSQR
jgi:2-dehydro-3-deoxygluconokinase